MDDAYARAPVRLERINVALVGLFLAGVYIDIKIGGGGGVQFPFIVSFVAGLGLLALHVDRAVRLALPTLMALSLLLLTTLAFNAAVFPERTSENLFGSLHLLYTFIACLGFFLGLQGMRVELLRRILAGGAVFLLVFGFLEVRLGFSVISDAFREAAYQNLSIYAADVRDVYRYGAVRPKVFSREPSFVGLFYAVFLIGWVILRNQPPLRTIVITCVAAGAGLFVIRSPIIAATIPVAFAFAFIRKDLMSGRAAAANLKSTIALVSFVCLVIAAATYFNLRPETEILDASVFQRLVMPVYVLIETLSTYPLFGYGVGVEQVVNRELLLAISSIPAFHHINPHSFMTGADKLTLFNNSFIGIWVGFGFAGGIVFLAIVRDFMKRAGVSLWVFVLLCSFVFFNATGGSVTIKTWFVFFLLAHVIARVEQVSSAVRTSRDRTWRDLSPTL